MTVVGNHRSLIPPGTGHRLDALSRHTIGGTVSVLCSMRLVVLAFALAMAVVDRSGGLGPVVVVLAAPLSFILMGSWYGRVSPHARYGMLAADMVVAVAVLLALADLAIAATYIAATVVLWGTVAGMWLALVMVVPLCVVQFLAFDDGTRGVLIGLVGSLLTGLMAWSGAALPARLSARAAAEAALPTPLGQDAAQAERLRLARDLHDTVAGDLAGIALVSGRLAELLDGDGERSGTVEMARWLDSAVRATHRQTRVVLGDLRDEPSSLSDALAALVQRWSARTCVPADLETTADLDAVAGPDRAQHVTAIVAELLENVHKHAGAGRVRVSASADSGSVVIVLADDGRGFDQDALPGRGFGIRGIRERAGLCRGTASWVSDPDHGTTACVVLPEEPAAQQHGLPVDPVRPATRRAGRTTRG